VNGEGLAPEWKRLELLGACVSANRRGKRISAETRKRLGAAQTRTEQARQKSPWPQLVADFGLEPLDQDVLVCSLAPEAQPHLGWMFQELQQGLASPFPTPALVQELFFMEPETAIGLRHRLEPAAPLLRGGLLESHAGDNYRPLRPTALACQRLLNLPATPRSVPGALPVAARATWDDLVLPERCLRGLREFLLWVTHREQVVGQWGARMAGGPVALFAGPSGTGKTLAAEVVATALGWPLYRVDLGLLVSKYIGETEKNLNALFDAAADRSLVLLFDEADSLFSKRGEVKEARDRYANMEVSHLLSRIEQHHGPCILTSNLRKQLDSAFARRFQVVIEFPRPTSEARAKLWRRHLPPRAPLAGEVQLEALGSACELTGGQIRNAALHAAFLAAADNAPIGLRHIASATWTELGKDGRETHAAALGLLASHLGRDLAHAQD
jgi:hypothetical protein